MSESSKLSKGITAQQIDALLPQTQCGLCGYKGCMPYAEAMARDEAEINLCPPGGIAGLQALGTLQNKDPAPFITEMEQKAKPRMLAVIREAECIGCTKCIKACPVDAILGAAKQMHSVLINECTGCELCIAPCPVDCIDLVTLPPLMNTEEKQQRADHFRQRYQARETRLAMEEVKLRTPTKPSMNSDKKNYIQEAILRAKQKKSGSADD